jgi:hypothetical protein
MCPDDPGENDSGLLVEHHGRVSLQLEGYLLVRQSAVARRCADPTRRVLVCLGARRRSLVAVRRASCRLRRLTVRGTGHHRDVALSTLARTRWHVGECAPSSSARTSAKPSARTSADRSIWPVRASCARVPPRGVLSAPPRSWSTCASILRERRRGKKSPRVLDGAELHCSSRSRSWRITMPVSMRN